MRNTFEYQEGNLYWIADQGSNKVAGTLAGWIRSNGYRYLRLKGKLFPVHRVVWEMHNGPIPEGLFIDHIDRDRLNNRIENLRLATNSQNQRNRKTLINNTTGFRGVDFHKRYNKFQAGVYLNNKRIHLGYFNTAEEASVAYETKAKEIFGEFYNEPTKER